MGRRAAVCRAERLRLLGGTVKPPAERVRLAVMWQGRIYCSGVTNHRPDVAITGLGAVSPHGIGVPALWDGLRAGRPAAAPITAFDPAEHGVRFACEAPADLTAHLPRRLLRQTDRFAQMSLIAAEEALTAAGLLAPPLTGDQVTSDRLVAPLDPAIDPTRVAVVMASGIGGVAEIADQHTRMIQRGPDRVRPYFTIAAPVNMAGGQIAIRHGLQGPVTAVVSACASAADAIGYGLDLIRSGRADIVLAGGSEAAITPLMMAGFHAAGAMSTRNDEPATASRPFDIDRDGFVAGEGAAVLVLERADLALRRDREPSVHLSGYGASNDAHDPTRPAPEGAGAVRAIRTAMADAGLRGQDIDHVNVHGTSTPLNDVAESMALSTVFGAGEVPPVTACKSSVGHLLGAAGAIEAVAAVLTLTDQQIPPTVNLTTQDPACPIEVVTDLREQSVSAVISNSFGFGGHNAVLAFTSAPAGTATT